MNHKLNNIVSRENSKLPNKIYNKYIASQIFKATY